MTEEDFKNMAAQLRKPQGEDGIKTGEWMNTGNLQMNKNTLSVLDPQNGDYILEIGMGNGLFVKDIVENKPLLRYTGCDLSQEMVTEAAKLNAAHLKSGQVNFLQGTLLDLPMQDESFDKLFTVNTIYFWDREIDALKELKRVLKPNGLLIIALRPKRQMMHYPFSKYGFNMFSKEELSDLLTKNGFSLIAVHENREPDLQLNGETMTMENLIVVAKKNLA